MQHPRLRIVSYNAWNTMPASWFISGNPRFDWFYKRMQLMAANIRAADPDIIVLQYPIFWYSAPSLMHRWIEQTFTHGFSHGTTGDKLRGKQLVLSFTSGAPEEMYRQGGLQCYPIDDFLPAYKQMAKLCGLQWCDYIYSGGLSYASRHDETELARMKDKAIQHAHLLVEKLKGMA